MDGLKLDRKRDRKYKTSEDFCVSTYNSITLSSLKVTLFFFRVNASHTHVCTYTIPKTIYIGTYVYIYICMFGVHI